jgi:hypothetical protein
MHKLRNFLPCIVVLGIILFSCCFINSARADDWASPLYTLRAEPLFQLDIEPLSYVPTGYSPDQIRAAYNLPSSGGAGRTIAIITAYDAPTIETDLTVFCNYFGLPVPNEENFEIYKMASTIPVDSGWAIETALDVQWARAIAPDAKILLVEAKSNLLVDLLLAVDYARNRPDVVAISMSWGTDEFRRQSDYNYVFTSSYDACFFAASGDDGAGILWPSSSSNVIAVGGTTLNVFADGSLSETAWSGSGGGISAYEQQPTYQSNYGLTTRRAVPDVSYNANPSTGVSIYTSSDGWVKVGGTSAGAPQWAAIHALGLSTSHENFYQNAKTPSYSAYFRDITLGSNGYSASVGYDYVTGLGSPVTINFNQTPIIVNSSIILSAAEYTTQLSAPNQFTAVYHQSGVEKFSYLSDGTSIISADAGTNIVLYDVSTASTDQEKWVFTSKEKPITIPAGANYSLSYYQLLAQTISYDIIGGGNPNTPTVTYYTAPFTESIVPLPQVITIELSLIPQTIWTIIGTEVSVPDIISGSVSERWTTPIADWITTSANQISSTIQYTHQYLLSIDGVLTQSHWCDSGITKQVTIQGIFDRSLSAGQRVSSYSIDNGASLFVTPTTGSVQIPILMDQAHQITVNSVTQYQIVLNSEASRLLYQYSQPTISDDDYWYDEGSVVTFSLNGIGERQSGTSYRLTTYTVNEVLKSVSTTSPVTVLNISINGPQTIYATSVTQYQLCLSDGSVKTVSKPTIQNDFGWYDVDTNVTITYNYSWNQTDTQYRLNAISYQINQGMPNTLDRSGSGDFVVQVVLNEPKTVQVASITQYLFTLTGNPSIVLSYSSPTFDDYFDENSTIIVTTANSWVNDDSKTRQRVISYTLNDETKFILQQEEQSSIPITLFFNTSYQLTFNSITQYLVSFEFKDHYGVNLLPSATLQIVKVLVRLPSLACKFQ